MAHGQWSETGLSPQMFQSWKGRQPDKLDRGSIRLTFDDLGELAILVAPVPGPDTRFMCMVCNRYPHCYLRATRVRSEQSSCLTDNESNSHNSSRGRREAVVPVSPPGPPVRLTLC